MIFHYVFWDEPHSNIFFYVLLLLPRITEHTYVHCLYSVRDLYTTKCILTSLIAMQVTFYNLKYMYYV